MTALNAETEKRWWLWMPELRSDDGCERGTKKRWWLWTPKLKSDDGSERTTKLRSDDDSKRRTEKRWWLWMLKLKTNVGSERWNWECGSKCQNENATLNPKRKRDLMALNVKLKMQGDSEGKICPSVACRYNSYSIGRVWKRLRESQKMLRWWVETVKLTTNMASQSIWLNHETWWCASRSQTPLT